MSESSIIVRVQSSNESRTIEPLQTKEATIGDILRELRRERVVLRPPALVLVCGADGTPVRVAAFKDSVVGLPRYGHQVHVHDDLCIRPKYDENPGLLADHALVAGLPNVGSVPNGLPPGERVETTWSQMEKHGLVCRLLVLASLQWPEDEQIDQAIGLFKEVVDHDGLARALAPALDDDKWARVVRLFGMPGPPLGEPDSATSHAARLTARLKRLDPADLHQVVAICGASKHVRQEACYADVVADLISWANHDPDLRFAAIEDALRTL